MQFGKVAHPEQIDFSLPPTPARTLDLLKASPADKGLQVSVGCAKWNKKDLKGFYPSGTKDELEYYSHQFNSIELNATFYQSPSKDQVEKWKEKTPEGFKFFPKVPQTISHYARLLHCKEPTLAFCDAIAHFEEKLGMAFLQLHENFKPKDWERLESFLIDFPKGCPLALEVRNEAWFDDKAVLEKLCGTLEKLAMAHIIVDTAGRRDMLHMRLTTPVAFVRFVGANHPSDYERLDEWVDRIEEWSLAGLRDLYFFVHQNTEVESPLLAAHFIEKLNQRLGLALPLPHKSSLF